MGYYSGTASDLNALQDVVFSACEQEGWARHSKILSRDGMFLQVSVVGPYLQFRAGTGEWEEELVNPTPMEVQIGTLGSRQTYPIQWPAEYELHLFAGEAYLVIRYGIDFYQWAAWGKSTISGLPGTGMWLAATMGRNIISPSGYPTTAPIGISPTGVNWPPDQNQGRTTAGLFWTDKWTTRSEAWAGNNYYLHHDFDGLGWQLGDAIDRVGAAAGAPLIGLLPNSWNTESVLLPIRPLAIRTAGGTTSIVADLTHSRWLRLDNYMPGDLITLGHDRWKVYPFYRKNAGERNGGPGINHTGTFGFAVRFQGP